MNQKIAIIIHCIALHYISKQKKRDLKFCECAESKIVTKMMMLNQLNAYKINRNVQIAITTPKMKESRRFRMLIFWIKLKWKKTRIRCHSHLDVHRAAFYLDINGNRLDMSFKRVWKRLNWWRCDIRFSFVSIAMLIWSFTRLCDLKLNKRQEISIIICLTFDIRKQRVRTHANECSPSSTCHVDWGRCSSKCLSHATVPLVLFVSYDWLGFY